MKRAFKALSLLALLVIIGVLLNNYFHTHPVAVLNPKGTIGAQEKHLILLATGLMLIVVIPVFVMTALIVWRYRADGKHTRERKYTPEWDRDPRLEALWWGIPIVIIMVLAVVAWKSSHQLDPYRPLASTNPPLTVQVVALDWKWLFIYPEQHVASVNLLEIPVNTPVNFQVTADAPMNSFWIPSLGGQIYAMPGMATQLHLIATSAGSYRGSSANISGEGFADMAFTARAASQRDFDDWVFKAKQSAAVLSQSAYDKLSKPGTLKEPVFYADTAPNLFTTIVYKYMDPSLQKQSYGSPIGSGV